MSQNGGTLKQELENKVLHYKTLTEQALGKISILAKEGTKEHTIALDFLTMANNYFNDGIHFQEQGDLLLALGAFSYAHAWLDAGVRAGVLDGKGDEQLFTLP